FFLLLFFMIPRHPSSTLFPYTTLFRSLDGLFAAKKLPVEFVLARFEPEPWEPLDTLGFARFLAFSQAPNWESELVRSRLIARVGDRKSTRLNSSHRTISYAVFCLKKKR